jgi:hypothetical protein
MSCSVLSTVNGPARLHPPVVGTPIIIAALTAIPARLSARRVVAEILRAELAL